MFFWKSIRQNALCSSAIIAVAALGLSTAAHAQSTEPELGITAGAFTISPSASVTGSWDSNYLRSPDEDEDSFILGVAGAVDARSNWSRHALRFGVGTSNEFFSADSEDNAFDANGIIEGVLDVNRATSITASVFGARLHEMRGNNDTVAGALEETVFFSYGGTLSGRYKRGMIRLEPFFGATRNDFDDVETTTGDFSQDDRDLVNLTYGLEVGYEYKRGYEIFLRGEGRTERYDDDIDAEGFERDSQGFSVLGGVNFDVTRLIEGRLGTGFQYATFEDDSLDDVIAVAFDAGLDWSVTPLTTVSLNGANRITPATQGDVSARTVLVGRLSAEHALRENISVNGFVEGRRENFNGVDGTERGFAFGVGADYDLTRYLTAEAGYQFEFEASDFQGNFTSNRVFIGLSAQY